MRPTVTAALLAAALLPGAAAAQAPARKPAAAPAAQPAPLRAVPPPAPPAAPRTEAAPARAGLPPAEPGWRGDLLLGLELADGEEALKLRADLERAVAPLAPHAEVAVVLSAGLVHDSTESSTTVAGFTASAEASAQRFELVPALRFRMSPVPRLVLHADAGLGGTFTTARAEATAGGVTTETSDRSFGGVLRFAAGGAYQAGARVRVVAELLGVNFHYGDAKGRSVSVLAGAGLRF